MHPSLANNRGLGIIIVGILWFIACPASASDVKALHTPNKTEIIGFTFGELSRDDIEKKDAQYENIIEEAGWRAQKLAPSSSTYNSHGYAWHMSKGGTQVVIKSEDVPWYWNDGSYKQISENEAKKGDIILMTDPDDPTRSHSAVVSDKPRWCKSKWGDGPVFQHKFDEHPFGKTLTFYRRAALAAPQNLRIVIQ